MDHVHERLHRELIAREEAQALRRLTVSQGLVDFASNDYLGFASDAYLKKMILAEIAEMPFFGSGGSRLLTGNNAYVELVENEIAAFHDAPAALFFNSGYEANSGLISTIVHRHDFIFYDAFIHASLREGIRLSGAKAYSFDHNDVDSLQRLFEIHTGNIFVVTESVFSMDGDISPLSEILALTEKYHAALILDEAHATGVIGNRGEGLAQHLGLHSRIFARVHTFGKAIGTNGAVVLGSTILRNYLINYCKPFIYTTAPNYLQLAAVRMAYRYLVTIQEPIRRLHHNLKCMKDKLHSVTYAQPVSTDSAIFSFIVPGNAAVKKLSADLRIAGFDMRPILSPTIPAGSERIRICLHAFNTDEEIRGALQLLQTKI
jgi:8-amino-7-oxononanoate synthase